MTKFKEVSSEEFTSWLDTVDFKVGANPMCDSIDILPKGCTNAIRDNCLGYRQRDWDDTEHWYIKEEDI